jgi:hypothetical protein
MVIIYKVKIFEIQLEETHKIKLKVKFIYTN